MGYAIIKYWQFKKINKGTYGLWTLARVWSVNEDNNGNIWIGTYDAGVWCYDGKNLTNYTTKDRLSSNAINTIYKDKKGELWFGTDGAGVCKFNGTSFSIFIINPSLKWLQTIIRHIFGRTARQPIIGIWQKPTSRCSATYLPLKNKKIIFIMEICPPKSKSKW